MRFFLILLIVSTSLALTPPATGALTVDGTAAEADEALRRLQRDFDNLRVSLQAQRGIREGDHDVIRSLRDRAAEYNARHRDNAAALAIELQLSVWLEEHDRVDGLFRRLVRAEPERTDLGLAWVRYFTRLGRSDRVSEIYTELTDVYPDSAEFFIERVRIIKQENQYDRALELLEEREFDAAAHPEAYLLQSELLFAANRFAEALGAIDAIPQGVIDARSDIASAAGRIRADRERYVELWEREQTIRAAEEAADDLPRVELIIADRGRIIIELFENEAPNTVANFISLIGQGFYDGTRFHRVEMNFMAQGGDPNTREGAEGEPGHGGPGWRIADEHTREDHRMHFADSIAMAKMPAPDTAGSQFYLNHTPTPHLNGRHTVFGRVLEGQDVVRSIRRDDVLAIARVLRKRDHTYEVEKLTQP
jgi:cyclophilin family peptidyl-prolyl cis-trans isomerase/thioredoxin-like negative regulator of GroEL